MTVVESRRRKAEVDNFHWTDDSREGLRQENKKDQGRRESKGEGHKQKTE